MKLHLAYFGDPFLRKKAEKVQEINEEIRQLVREMHEIMIGANGVGIAAPQVKRSLALFLIYKPRSYLKLDLNLHPDDKLKVETLYVFINPKLSHPSDQKWSFGEGCISIPSFYTEVERPWSITIDATNLEGVPFKLDLVGYEAKMIMHENDHLNGVLIIDRIPAEKRKEIEPALRKIKNQYYKKK